MNSLGLKHLQVLAVLTAYVLFSQFIDSGVARAAQPPVSVGMTLFSWETTDNLGTPDVDERFEGWDDLGLVNPSDFNTTQHSIVNNVVAPGAATAGSFALQIQRVDALGPDYRFFHWGSNFVLNSNDGHGGTAQEVQNEIDRIVAIINSATAIAFDVRIDPSPYSPAFVQFGVHVRDEAGHFYVAAGDGIAMPTVGMTATYVIPTELMNDSNLISGSLRDDKIMEGTRFLAIGIATNTDMPGMYQIDNFRVIGVPEPNTLVLLAGMLLAAMRRRNMPVFQ